VYVTVRVVELTTPAAAVAASEYVTFKEPCAILVMLVTRSTAVVLSDCDPALLAPVGAVRFAESVTPAGIAEPMLAVIFEPVWFVVTAHVAAAVALAGSLPAVAVFTTSEGLPEKAIWLMASTWKVTVWVAVWAVAMRATPIRMARVERKRLAVIGQE